MDSKMRRHLPGTFAAQELAPGAWRLSRSQPEPVDVLVRGADAASGALPAHVRDLDIEWRREDVLLSIATGAQRRVIKAQTVIVHEPLAGLYAVLPLAKFDGQARRFWRRVFGLVRIPGGRYLVGFLARRGRASR
jgi:hypothetical protein